jgi:hypothetical protein
MNSEKLDITLVNNKYPHNNNPRFSYTMSGGNWEYEGQPRLSDKVLDLKYIIDNMLTEDRLETIKLKEIAWKSKHLFPYDVGENCTCCGGYAYKNCDPTIPGIVAYNLSNPFDNKYRMLDGRHRIMRHLFDGKTESEFYVFDFNEIKNFIRNDKYNTY